MYQPTAAQLPGEEHETELSVGFGGAFLLAGNGAVVAVHDPEDSLKSRP